MKMMDRMMMILGWGSLARARATRAAIRAIGDCMSHAIMQSRKEEDREILRSYDSCTANKEIFLPQSCLLLHFT